jgi:hypothetical protein
VLELPLVLLLLHLVVEWESHLLRVWQELRAAILVVIGVLLLQAHHEVVVLVLRVDVTRQRVEVLVIIILLELLFRDVPIG